MSFSEEELQKQAMELQAQIAQDPEEDDKFADHRDSEETEPEDNSPGFKKFVFRINTEHIPDIQALTYDERNLFINDLLIEYKEHNEELEEMEILKQKIKKGVTIALIVLVGIPLLLWFISYSLNVTKSNYSGMQKNFQKLYKDKKKRY